MNGDAVEHEFQRVEPPKDGDIQTWARAEHFEEQRVVDLIRTAIPQASVFFYDSMVSVRATADGATRDVVLVPGDRFTVTSTTVIRRPRP